MVLVASPTNELEHLLQNADVTKDIMPASKASLINDMESLQVAEETIAEKPLKFRVLKGTDIPHLHH